MPKKQKPKPPQAVTIYHQWLYDGVEIAGATGSTFEVQAWQDPNKITCKTWAENRDARPILFALSAKAPPA